MLSRRVADLDSIDRILGAVVVIAANAGGTWTHIGIGDATTTMPWIHVQISTLQTMKVMFKQTILCSTSA